MDDRQRRGEAEEDPPYVVRSIRVLVARAARWLRSTPGQQVRALVLSALVVQLVLPYRYDNAAHAVGGGALVLMLVGAAPSNVVRRLGAWADLGMMVLVLGLAWLTEMTVFGPFDLVDIAFTLAGALVVVAVLPELASVGTADARSLVVVGSVLALGSLVYRYVLGIGA